MMMQPTRLLVPSVTLLLAGLAGLAPLAPSAETDARAAVEFREEIQPFLASNCYLCHNQKLQMGKLELDALTDYAEASKRTDIWGAVLEKLRAGDMPPEGQPRPPEAEVKTVTDWVESQLEHAAQNLPLDPGRVTVRRLNRDEYNNTIRDLLGIDFRPADDFPADDSGYGFDNIGDVLSLSPILMEKYLAAADKIVEMAIVVPPPANPTLEKYLAPRIKEDAADSRVAYSLEGAFHVEHRFPVDAEYELTVRVVDRRYRPRRGEPPPPLPPTAKLALSFGGEPVGMFEVEAGEYGKRRFEVRVKVRAGNHSVDAAFIEGLPAPEVPEPGDNKKDPYAGDRKLFVDYLEVQGPFDPKPPPLAASHRRIFTCGAPYQPPPPGCAQQILGRLARRAYRRPVEQREIDALVGLAEMVEKADGPLEEGIRVALKAVLVSPHFLFRIERDPDPTDPSALHRISQYELATRLSYFLWSSMPDEELFRQATELRLRDPEVLKTQVRRMLQDPKSRALVENFAGQWLQLRNLESASPDPDRFPRFDDALRKAMRRETEMFFETIVREDRSILDFIDGRYTFLNQRLALHYGIPGVDGDEFRQVTLRGDQRSGVLTQASILTVSSFPTRTSPVLRGKWVLENFLGAPPPPPPADIPELDETKVGLSGTLREQLEQHRADPSCAVCHTKMDVLGFGLENYDAVGVWRTRDGDFPIDASGTLPGGRSFSKPSELKEILRSDPESFARCLSEKMLTYALGRGLESYDKVVLREIVQRVAANDYRFTELILGIVESMPFQMRRGEGGKP